MVNIWIIYGLSMVNIWIIYLGKFHHDLTGRPKPIDDGECKGNHPQMVQQFRLVKYSNLPRILVLVDGQRLSERLSELVGELIHADWTLSWIEFLRRHVLRDG